MNHVYWTWIVVVGFVNGPSDVLKPSCSAAGAGGPKWRASYGFQTSKYKERSGNSQGCYVFRIEFVALFGNDRERMEAGIWIWWSWLLYHAVLSYVSFLFELLVFSRMCRVCVSVDFPRHPQLDDCNVTNILEAAFSYFSRRYKIKNSQTLGNCFERVFCCQSRSFQQTTASLAKLFGYSASIQQIALWLFTVTRFHRDVVRPQLGPKW